MENQKTIDQLTDLELALFMQQQYESIVRAQGMIINAEKVIQMRMQNITPEPTTPIKE